MAINQTRLHVPIGTTTADLLHFWTLIAGDPMALEAANRIMYQSVLPFLALGSYNVKETAFQRYRRILSKKGGAARIPYRYSTRDMGDPLMNWLRSSPFHPQLFSSGFAWCFRFPELYVCTLLRPVEVSYIAEKVLGRHKALVGFDPIRRSEIQKLAEEGLAILESPKKLQQVGAWLAKEAA